MGWGTLGELSEDQGVQTITRKEICLFGEPTYYVYPAKDLKFRKP